MTQIVERIVEYLWNERFAGNPLWRWTLALLVAILAAIVIRRARLALIGRLGAMAGRTETRIDDIVVEVLRRTRFFFTLALAILLGSLVVEVQPDIERALGGLVVVAVMIQGGLWAVSLIRASAKLWLSREGKETVMPAVSFFSRLIVWALVLIVSLDNLGVDVTALIAGLGIGGIAIALAAQNILGDLFGSIIILIDRPFEVGDFIVVGEHLGTVRHIGVKTTRMRALSGEEIVFGNSDLLSSRVRNFRRMEHRRITFRIGVTYQTPPEKVRTIPDLLREIVEAQELAAFDRAHFQSFGDFALVFEVVYNIKSPDYAMYMDTQQSINLSILERFARDGIEFAYPTQTVFVA